MSLPPREKGSNTHNVNDPLCAQFNGEAVLDEVCNVCPARKLARDRARAVMAREIGS